MIKLYELGYNVNVQEIVLSNPQLAWCTQVLAAKDLVLASARPLKAEASHRQFFRLTTSGANSYVFMSSPPELERNDAFRELATVFNSAGVPVPKILAEDRPSGWFLLTDLGTTHFEDIYSTELESPALGAAFNQLVPFSQIKHPSIPEYTEQRLLDEMGIFDEWFVHQYLGEPLQVGPCQDELLAQILVQPKACVHLDYHCRNLLYENNKLGIVDFQDARLGPILYDPASLLRDCYHQFPAQVIDQWLAYYANKHPLLQDVPKSQLKIWLDYTALQRQLKAVGIFARLNLRDSKSTHLTYILPVLKAMHTLAQNYSELGYLVAQLDHCIKTYANVH